jgi:HTH-type transcriptional regulator / antitoxin HipB
MESLKPLATVLKDARQRKHLSQRELGARVGLPQSHISKIENAAVDLQASNLIEIARALDLELILLPRQLIPAARALQNLRDAPSSATPHSAGVSEPPAPAYRLDEEESGGD